MLLMRVLSGKIFFSFVDLLTFDACIRKVSPLQFAQIITNDKRTVE